MSMQSRKDIMNALESNAEKIRSYGVKKLCLFGSGARDTMSVNSDVDILVDFEENRGLFDDYTGLQNFLEDILGRNVDLVKRGLIREELKESILSGEQIEAKI